VVARSTNPAVLVALASAALFVQTTAEASSIDLSPSTLTLTASPPSIPAEWLITLEPLDDASTVLGLRVVGGEASEWYALLAVSYRSGGSGAQVLDVTDVNPTCFSGCLVIGTDVPTSSVELGSAPGTLNLLLEFALADPASALRQSELIVTRSSGDGSESVAAGLLVPEPSSTLLLAFSVAILFFFRRRSPSSSSTPTPLITNAIVW